MQPNDGKTSAQPILTHADEASASTAPQQPATIRIELAGAPQGKGRARFSRKTGFAYTPAATRSYEGMLRHEATLAMAGRAPLDGPLALTVAAYVPIPGSWSHKRQQLAAQGVIRPTTRPDFDNYLKALDALNSVVWKDDSQIVDQHFMKLYSERPRLVIRVEPVNCDTGLEQCPARLGEASHGLARLGLARRGLAR